MLDDTAPAAALAERARVLLDLGRPREALPLLAQAAAADPSSADVFCLMAFAHGELGQWRHAREQAEKALAAVPEHEWAHRLRTIALLHSGSPWRVLHSAAVSARLHPDVPETLALLAAAQMRAGLVGRARRTAKRLLAMAPDECLSHEVQAEVALRRRRWKEAEQSCRSALRLHPHDYAALNNLGVALARQRRWHEAVLCFHDALKAAPLQLLPRRNLQHAVREYVDAPQATWWVISPWLVSWIPNFYVEHAGHNSPAANDLGSAINGVGIMLSVILALVHILFGRRRRFHNLPADLQRVLMQRALRKSK